jgi:hypothetical protein
MGFNFEAPRIELPHIKVVTPSENFVENMGEQVTRLRAMLKPDEDFVGEYFTGAETITITHIGVAGREMVQLIGFDQERRRCYMFSHVASVNILFRICNTTPEQKRQYGFTVDKTS